MSDKARKLIAKAIKIHCEEDDASDIGAYRDVVTEVLHLAYEKFKTGPYSGVDLRHWICSSGYDAFLEELALIELDRLNKIPDKNLPLHTVEEFEFDSTKEMFEERLKGKPDGRK
jgi:hypothetical protein